MELFNIAFICAPLTGGFSLYFKMIELRGIGRVRPAAKFFEIAWPFLSSIKVHQDRITVFYTKFHFSSNFWALAMASPFTPAILFILSFIRSLMY